MYKPSYEQRIGNARISANKHGHPFLDRAGRLMDRFLEAANLPSVPRLSLFGAVAVESMALSSEEVQHPAEAPAEVEVQPAVPLDIAD